MHRSEQQSYCKAGIDWHAGGLRTDPTLAAPITEYEGEFAVQAQLLTLEDERRFESLVRETNIAHQRWLEQQQNCQRPLFPWEREARLDDDLARWLAANRKTRTVEEVLTYEESVAEAA
jgi:hypothetical protein